jgi:hypothetical protein
MVAVLPPILSDARPDFARKAGLGDLFHYWRGRSGRRYLFTVIRNDSLADFRSAVVLFAEPQADGRLLARAATILDGAGRSMDGGSRLAGELSPEALILVHFLAATESERRRILEDLAGTALRIAA